MAQRQARAVGQVQRRREGLVLGRRGGARRSSCWSGLILLFPNFDQTRAVMQMPGSGTPCAALLYIAISLGHIYLGTIGVEGAYQAMRNGYVDETWAKEHHEYWYDDVKRVGRAPRRRRRRTGRRAAQEGEIMKKILAALVLGAARSAPRPGRSCRRRRRRATPRSRPRPTRPPRPRPRTPAISPRPRTRRSRATRSTPPPRT